MSINNMRHVKRTITAAAFTALFLLSSINVLADTKSTTVTPTISNFYMDIVKKQSAYISIKKMLEGSVTVILENYGASPSVVAEWESVVSGKTVQTPFRISGFDFGVNTVGTDVVSKVLVNRGTYFSRYAARKNELAQIAKILSYKVVEGDTFNSIANKFGITTTTIFLCNQMTAKSTLKPGKVIYFPSVSGVVHKVVKGDTVSGLTKIYGVSSSSIIRVNGLSEPYLLKLNQKLVIPGATKLPTVAKASSSGKTTSTSRSTLSLGTTFAYPVKGVLTSKFGYRWGRAHEGVDFGVDIGTPIKAASSGKVIFSGVDGAYGKLVKIQHANGVETWYAHNSALLVSVGDYVDKGDIISKSGATGRVTGPHLHFEVRINGRAVNPLGYLD